jgi:two-component system, OmpR family, alkaline phosphatase synthesis response regulator PhoP
VSANMSTGERERQVVLIADNEPDIVELVRFELETEGYDVIRAVNGEQAYDLACEHRPDLVLVDVHMPNGKALQPRCAA